MFSRSLASSFRIFSPPPVVSHSAYFTFRQSLARNPALSLSSTSTLLVSRVIPQRENTSLALCMLISEFFEIFFLEEPIPVSSQFLIGTFFPGLDISKKNIKYNPKNEQSTSFSARHLYLSSRRFYSSGAGTEEN